MAAVYASAVAAAFTSKRHFGLMTVRRWDRLGLRRQNARVFVNGEDVTDDCVEFHDLAGWADVWVRDGQGHFVWNPMTKNVRRRRLHGAIHVVV